MESRRVAKVRVPASTLADLIDLPPSAEIVGLVAHLDPPAIDVLVQDPSFEPYPEDSEAPYVMTEMQIIEGMTSADGHAVGRLRFRWEDMVEGG